MPKVTQVTAAKDYPKLGIAKGEKCYVWRVRLQRGGVDCRSKTYPRPSQLNFGFTGQLGDIELDMGNATDKEELEGLKEQLSDLRDEQEEKFDNMPEGLQQGDTGQLLEERRDGLESWVSDIETALDEYDSEVERIDGLDADDLMSEVECAEDDPDEEAIETARQELRDAAFEQCKQACLDANPGL